MGPQKYVESKGIEVKVVDDKKCYEMIQEFIKKSPDLWNEDIGI